MRLRDKTPAWTPSDFTGALFDEAAASYDNDTVRKLHYMLPQSSLSCEPIETLDMISI